MTVNARSLAVTPRAAAGGRTSAAGVGQPSSSTSGWASASHSSSRLESTPRTSSPSQEIDVGELLGAGVLRHGAAQRPVGVGEVPQHHPLGAGQPVERDVLGERHGPLVHVPDDGLRLRLVLGDPGCAVPVRPRRPPRSGRPAARGWSTSSSSSIRSSYSMPSAFIAATASPRALNRCADSTGRGPSRVASISETTSSGVGLGRRDRGCPARPAPAATAAGPARSPAAGRMVSRYRRPVSSGSSSRSTTPGGDQRPPIAMARRACRSCRARGSWLPSISARIAVNALPGREITPSTMAWDTRKCDVSGSGLGGHELVEGRLRPADEALGWLAPHHLSLLRGVVAGLRHAPARSR